MNGSADTRAVVQVWLAKAQDDLAAAETLLEAAMPAWLACFHAQQCVEKALKGLLVWLGLPFPKTHDIKTLVDLVPVETRPAIDRRLAAELSESAVAGRYPGTEGPSQDLARELVAEARRVHDFVKARTAGEAPAR